MGQDRRTVVVPLLISAVLVAAIPWPLGAESCAPPLDPTGAAVNLVISEIDPGSHIEIYNPTGAAINLSTSSYQLCSPFVYAALATLGPGTVPAGGYYLLPWPSGFTDVDSGGEVILFADGNFGDSTKIVDFVCWGVNPHDSRKGQAESVGKWTGACADALEQGAIHRLRGTDGTSAASYDVLSAPSPMTCWSGLIFRDGFEE
jgi:hypothetical protein